MLTGHDHSQKRPARVVSAMPPTTAPATPSMAAPVSAPANSN